MVDIQRIKRPKGYFSNKDNCINELKELAKLLGQPNQMPTFKEIQARSPGLLLGLRNELKSMSHISKHANLLLSKKQQEQLYAKENKSFNYIKAEVEKVIKRKNLKRMPIKNELPIRIYNAIVKYHGGLSEVARILNLTSFKKKDNYWRSILNIENELRTWCENNNHPNDIMPSATDLKNKNANDLCIGIVRHQGGFYELAKKLNKKMSHEIKPPNYWRNWDVLQEAIMEISNATERPNIMPTYEELGSKLTHAINRYHGGFQKVAKKIGLLIIRDHNNYEIRRLLDVVESARETSFYITSIIGKVEYIKIGIAYDYASRAKDDSWKLYPKEPLWARYFRRDVAWAIEQKILKETINMHPGARELTEWEGWYELRDKNQFNYDDIDAYCDQLEIDIEKNGWKEYVLEHNLLRESDLTPSPKTST